MSGEPTMCGTCYQDFDAGDDGTKACPNCAAIRERAADEHLRAEVPVRSGNSVELRLVGKHKWLYINGVHVACVRDTKLTMSRDSVNTFTVEFDVDTIKGFDNA